MKKLLLSFLGTGDYKEVRYRLHENVGSPTSLSAAAIGEFFPDYEPVILVTKEAYAKNWNLTLDSFRKLKLEEPRMVEIPSGKSEEEIWRIVEKLVGLFVEDDSDALLTSVVLDITHGFRAQPLLIFATISLLEEMQYAHAENVLYGAYDAKDEYGIAPVFDLRPLLDLSAWSRALGDLRRYGYAAPLRHLLRETSRKAHTGKEKYKPKGLVGLGDTLEQVTSALAAIRPIQAHQGAKRLPDKIEIAKEDLKKIPELRPLSTFFTTSFKRYENLGIGDSLFSKEGLKALARMIELYMELEQYPQAITLAREALVTLRSLDLKTDPLEASARKAAESEINAAATVLRLKGKPASADIISYARLWNDLADLRNDVDHAGFRSGPRTAEAVKKQAGKLCGEVITWLNKRD